MNACCKTVDAEISSSKQCLVIIFVYRTTSFQRIRLYKNIPSGTIVFDISEENNYHYHCHNFSNEFEPHIRHNRSYS